MFFKVIGFGKIIYHIKRDYQYSIVVIALLTLLVIWSTLLGSGFQSAAVRHIAYFIPILSIIVVIGMLRNWNEYYKIYCLMIVVLATYYFLHFDIFIVNYADHFGGLWIDPFTKTFSSLNEFRLAAAVLAGLIVFEFVYEKYLSKSKKLLSSKAILIICIGILVIQVGTLLTVNVKIPNLYAVNQSPIPGWENHVMEPINYLTHAEPGNILSMRAPAIISFTNRTVYDLFNIHSLKSIMSIISAPNASSLKEELMEKGIKYLVIPNEKSPLKSLTQSLDNMSKLLKLIVTSSEYRKIAFNEFTIFKVEYPNSSASLITNLSQWNKFGDVDVSKNSTGMILHVETTLSSPIYHRAFINTQLGANGHAKSSDPLLLYLDYSTNSLVGQAKYALEIRASEGNALLISPLLDDTYNKMSNQTFVLPSTLNGHKIELRLYVITESPGIHDLVVRKLSLAHS